MPLADAGTSAHAMPAASLPACKETGQHKTLPACRTLRDRKCWWGLENVASSPNAPAEGKEGETQISFQGRCFSRITCGEAAALPVSAGSHRARARAPQTRSDTPVLGTCLGLVRAGNTSAAVGWCLGRHPQLFLISLPQNK